MNNEQIGTCFACNAPIYAGGPRHGIWRYILPPRITRTCVCFDMILYSLVTGVHMLGALVMMPVREE